MASATERTFLSYLLIANGYSSWKNENIYSLQCLHQGMLSRERRCLAGRILLRDEMNDKLEARLISDFPFRAWWSRKDFPMCSKWSRCRSKIEEVYKLCRSRGRGENS